MGAITSTIDSPKTVVRRLSTEGERIHFEKDLLECGHYEGLTLDENDKIVPWTWDVTVDDLDRLIADFSKMRERGLRVPLQYEHAGTAENRCGDITELFRDGCRLMSRGWTTANHENKIFDADAEVSISLASPWKDGNGNLYANAPLHVAVTTNPVYANQGSFRRISLSLKRSFQVAEDTMPAGNGEGGDGGGDGGGSLSDEPGETMSVTDVISIIEEATGWTFPPEVDTPKEIKIFVKSKMEGAENATEPPADVLETAPIDEMAPLALRNVCRGLRKQLSTLKRDNEARRKVELSKAETEYTRVLDLACSNGVIVPAQKEELLEVGKEAGYKLSLVRHLSNAAPQTQLGSKTRRLANGSPPGLPEDAAIKQKQKELSDRYFPAKK